MACVTKHHVDRYLKVNETCKAARNGCCGNIKIKISLKRILLGLDVFCEETFLRQVH